MTLRWPFGQDLGPPEDGKTWSSMSVGANWSLLTNHARTVLCIAQNPEVRLGGIAASVKPCA
jgi:hypothetical protein